MRGITQASLAEKFATYWQANLAPHIGRSRFMKCPACGKWSYQKKVISKDVSDDDKSDE